MCDEPVVGGVGAVCERAVGAVAARGTCVAGESAEVSAAWLPPWASVRLRRIAVRSHWRARAADSSAVAAAAGAAAARTVVATEHGTAAAIYHKNIL